MATVIDELVVKLGLDASAFAQGRQSAETDTDAMKRAVVQAQAEMARAMGMTIEQFKQWTAEANKADEAEQRVANNTRERVNNVVIIMNRAGKEISASGEQGAEFFSKMKGEALGLIGVLMGATGLGAIIRGAAHNMAELGRQAALMNVDPQRLSAYGMAMERFGASAGSTRNSLQGIGGAIEQFKLTGQGDINRFLNPIGADINNSPFEVLEKFITFAQAHKNDGQLVNFVGHGLGVDQSTINASLQIKSMAQFQGELNDAMRDSPTAQEVKNAQELQGAWARAEQAAEGLANKITSDLSPALEAVLKWGTDEIHQNPQLVEAITGIVTGLTALKGIQLSAKAMGLTGVAEAIGAIFTPMALAGASAAVGAYNGAHNLPMTDDSGQVTGNWGGKDESNNPAASPAMGSAARSQSRQTVEDYFLSQGYSQNQVAGILGNVAAESSFDPKADNGTHAGLFQWDTARQAQFQTMFHKGVKDATPLEQAQFAQWELTHTEKAAGDALRATNTRFEAGKTFSSAFERPGTGVKGEMISDYRGGLAMAQHVAPTASGAPAEAHAPQAALPRVASQYDVHPSQMVAPVAPPPSTAPANNVTVNVGGVTVNSNAAGSKALGHDIGQSIVAQANRGLN